MVAVACICFDKALWDEVKKELKGYDAMFDSDTVVAPRSSSKKSNSNGSPNFKRFLMYLKRYRFRLILLVLFGDLKDYLNDIIFVVVVPMD